jgi:hypothetical protein
MAEALAPEPDHGHIAASAAARAALEAGGAFDGGDLELTHCSDSDSDMGNAYSSSSHTLQFRGETVWSLSTESGSNIGGSWGTDSACSIDAQELVVRVINRSIRLAMNGLVGDGRGPNASEVRRYLLKDLLLRAAVAAGATVPADPGEVCVTVRNWDRRGPAAPEHGRVAASAAARAALEARHRLELARNRLLLACLSHHRLAPDGVLCEADIVTLVHHAVAAAAPRPIKCKPAPFDCAELELRHENGSEEDPRCFSAFSTHTLAFRGEAVWELSTFIGNRRGRCWGRVAHKSHGNSCRSECRIEGQELVVRLSHQRRVHSSPYGSSSIFDGRQTLPDEEGRYLLKALLVRAAVMAGATVPADADVQVVGCDSIQHSEVIVDPAE